MGSSRFRLVDYKPDFAVMTGLGNGQNAFCKVYIAPLQGDKLANTQAAVQAEKQNLMPTGTANTLRALSICFAGKYGAVTAAKTCVPMRECQALASTVITNALPLARPPIANSGLLQKKYWNNLSSKPLQAR